MIKVSYIDHMGSDLKAVNAARVSFNKESEELSDKDIKLIEYLAKNAHLSPFQHNSLTVLIECPLYIRSQIVRHRMATYSEISRRYTSDNIEFYDSFDFKEQAKNNKQCSGSILNETKQKMAKFLLKKAYDFSLQVYEALLKLGVSKEQARIVLPVGTMTKFYMTSDLRNWIHFLKLRDHPHAQEEAQIIAKRVKELLLELFPHSTKALLEANNDK